MVSVGDRVLWQNKHAGTVRFVGSHPAGKPGVEYAGVEFDGPLPKGHDGLSKGIRLFTGRPGHCRVVPARALQPYTVEGAAAATIGRTVRANQVRQAVRGERTQQLHRDLEEFRESMQNSRRQELQKLRSLGSSFPGRAPRIPSVPRRPRQVVFRVDNVPEDPGYRGPRFEFPLDEAQVMGLVDHFHEGGRLSLRQTLRLLDEATRSLEALPNVPSVSVHPGERLTIVGDTHGHLNSLYFIWDRNGTPSATNRYLFNGDFVDRGNYSAEIVLLLAAFHVLDPSAALLNRGNHEDAEQNYMYENKGPHDVGFHIDCARKYGSKATDAFCAFQTFFNALPLAHVISSGVEGKPKRIFCCHGGLFMESGVTVDMLNRINRFRPIPVGGTQLDDRLFTELMWSDPDTLPGSRMNIARGNIPCMFGRDLTASFCRQNRFDLVVRSHQAEDKGYAWWHGGKLLTIFSASGYHTVQVGSRAMPNKGAVMVLNADMSHRIEQFVAPALTHTKPSPLRPSKENSPAERPRTEPAAPPSPASVTATSGASAGSVAGGGATSAAGSERSVLPPRPGPSLTKAQREEQERKEQQDAFEDFDSTRNSLVELIVEHKQDLYWFLRHRDEDNDGKVPYGVWLEAMAACLPFKPSLGSWRSVNQVFELVALEPPPPHVSHGAERYVDYVKFLERYVGEISYDQEEVQTNVTRSISERLFQNLHDEKTKSQLQRLRRDADGKVALEDLASTVARAGWGLTEDQLERLLRSLDRNRNGRVDLSEFLHQFRVEYDPERAESARRSRSRTTSSGSTDEGGFSPSRGTPGLGGGSSSCSPGGSSPGIRSPSGRPPPSSEGSGTASSMDSISSDTKACLSRLGEEVLNRGEEILHVFAKEDGDKDGMLTREEFARALRQFRPEPPLTEAQVAEIVDLVDSDDSGLISPSDFRSAFRLVMRPPGATRMSSAAAAAGAGGGAAAAAAPESFNWSMDFLGSIFDEVAIQLRRNTGQLALTFHEMDKDGTGRISRDEFGRGLRRAGIQVAPEMVDAIVEHTAADEEGNVNYHDFLSALGTKDRDRGDPL